MHECLHRLLLACWHVVGHVLTAIALALDKLFSPVLTPASEWLSRRSLVQRIERAIAALPPYAVLVLVGTPVVVRQSAKFFAFFMIGSGSPIVGTVLYVGSRILNILLVSRIYDAGRENLLSIKWFERVHDWLDERSKKRLAAFHETSFYKWAHRTLHKSPNNSEQV